MNVKQTLTVLLLVVLFVILFRIISYFIGFESTVIVALALLVSDSIEMKSFYKKRIMENKDE